MPYDSAAGTPLLEVRHLVKHFVRKQGLFQPSSVVKAVDDVSFTIDEGEMFVVPKGVRHNPVAERECHLMLIERKSTLHTGDVVTEKTRSLAEQLRPV